MRVTELFQNMLYVAAITGTWSQQGRVTVDNFRGIDDDRRVFSRIVGMFVMTGDHWSEDEALMVKGIIDRDTGGRAVLASVTSHTKNRANKMCRVLAEEENVVGYVAHMLHLVVHDFLSAFSHSPSYSVAVTIF